MNDCTAWKSKIQMMNLTSLPSFSLCNGIGIKSSFRSEFSFWFVTFDIAFFLLIVLSFSPWLASICILQAFGRMIYWMLSATFQSYNRLFFNFYFASIIAMSTVLLLTCCISCAIARLKAKHCCVSFDIWKISWTNGLHSMRREQNQISEWEK